MLKDGRIWNYIEVYERCVYLDSLGNIIDWDNDTIDFEDIWYTCVEVLDTFKYTRFINGTEIIDNRLCHKLYWNKNSTACSYFYEEDGKVYGWYNSEWELNLDFTLEVGEPHPFYPQITVSSVDTINVAGELYRRIGWGYRDDEGEVCWIEGVGCTDYGPYYPREPVPYPFSLRWQGIISVYDGETCIFERKDFHKPGIGHGVESLTNVSSDAKQKAIHDLQGRRLQTPPRKGVYISGGKKLVK